MKALLGLLLASTMATSACAYAVGGVSGDGKVVIAKNNGFLFGIFSKVYVCQVTPGGVTSCAAADAP